MVRLMVLMNGTATFLSSVMMRLEEGWVYLAWGYGDQVLRLAVLSKNICCDRAMPNGMVAIAHLRKTHFDNGNA